MTAHPKFDPSARVLLGPGPSMTHPRVIRALSAPTVGHLDPELLALYAEEQDLLRTVFETRNEWTFALSGTGTSGMEAALVNLVEPGDRKSTRLNSSHGYISYAVFCLEQKRTRLNDNHVHTPCPAFCSTRDASSPP